jgi:hypothetical protein
MRAILIDAVNCTVKEIQNKGDLDSIYKAINVEMIEVGNYDPETGDTLYVDEEGRINGTAIGFELFGKKFAGSGIIFGTQPDGENGPAAIDLKDVNPRFFTFQPAFV